MNIAIVLAAGSGSRMKSDIPKQFIKIKDREVIYYSLNTFQKNEHIDKIVLVTKEDDIEYCKKEIIDRYGFSKVVAVIAGGKERYDSVYNGLMCAKEHNASIVMIHDGARPFVNDQMIIESICDTAKYGACTVGVPVKDTIKMVELKDDGVFGKNTPDRKYLYQIQTPQTFNLELLLNAYNGLKKDNNYNITDDSMIVELYTDVSVKIVEGAYENIKITTPEDIEIAEKFIEKNL